MDTAVRKNWTQKEFFDWAENQDTRYEFDGFQPVAMTGGTFGHGLIGRRLNYALLARLDGGRCTPVGPDVGVATTGKKIRYPDALITCSKVKRSVRVVPGVVVVFEVTSPSADCVQTDRVEKVAEYAAVPSILRYVIVESSKIELTVLERVRGNDPWNERTLTDGATLHIPEVGIEIPVYEIYQDIDFSEE